MELLIDADVLRYRIGFVCQHTKYYVLAKGAEEMGPLKVFSNKEKLDEYMAGKGEDGDLYVKDFLVAEHISKCLHTLKLQLQAIINRFPGCTYRLFLSGKDNFRDSLVDYYKANRDRGKRPLHFKNMTDYMIEYWDAEVIDGIEADDALGIAQMENYNYDIGNTEETCIVSIDKDLDGIPGLHYNFVQDIYYEMSPVEADMFFYSQMLTGDTADNIPGMYKIVKTKAMPKYIEPLAHMSKPLDMWNHVWDVYSTARDAKKIEMTDDELRDKLIEIGKLLWIWRKPNDHWSPPDDN